MLFDPFELDTGVTPARIRAALRQQDYTRAILMAFRLNERKLLQEALESVPWGEGERRGGQGERRGRAARTPGLFSAVFTFSSDGAFSRKRARFSPFPTVEVVSSSLPELYVEKVLEFLASSFEVSCHLEFYLIWTQKLLLAHGQKLKSR